MTRPRLPLNEMMKRPVGVLPRLVPRYPDGFGALLYVWGSGGAPRHSPPTNSAAQPGIGSLSVWRKTEIMRP